MAGKSQEDGQTVKALGWAAREVSGAISPFDFSRRAPGERDVQVKILYCGICSFDTEMINNKFGFTRYPFVLGHEIVGVVSEVGRKVQKFKIGDKVGVGTMIGSCRTCYSCTHNLENYCPKVTLTEATSGGCSNLVIADEDFVFHWPVNLPLDLGAPLLCAGITVYSPLKNFELDKPGLRIGVVGLGGIGHIAVKFAKAFGAKVTVISSSESKKVEAIEKYGADSFLVSSDPGQMLAAAGTLDGVIDTVPAPHSILPFLDLLLPRGKLIILGAPMEPFVLPIYPLLQGGRVVAGSATGGLKQIQEMLHFAAEHNIVADGEVIPIDDINTAIKRIEKGDVKYRFVVDIGNTLKSA
uniref:Dihydrocorinantheine aldehyde synthase n=1 Tax=Cinchona pubescens TaxID=50278 RepID=A0A7T8G1Q6_9GENT|nr:dihydrocorinantheine aldehyde synthase [Cinchona pubescens]